MTSVKVYGVCALLSISYEGCLRLRKLRRCGCKRISPGRAYLAEYVLKGMGARISALSIPLGALAVVCYVLGTAAAIPALRSGAVLFSLLAMVLQFASLALMARVFLLGALLSYCVGFHFFPAQRELLSRALEQGVGFACFLSVLGMIRYPVRNSAFLKRAVGALLSIPPRWQYSSVTLASQFMSLLFNIGVIPLVFDAISHKKAEAITAQEQTLVLASLRGSALTTLWSPLGIGFTIVTTSIVGLSSIKLFAVALVMALAIAALDCATRRLPQSGTPPAGTVDAPQPGAGRAMLGTLAICVLLLLAALLLHVLTAWAQLVCVMILLVVVGCAWLCVERPAQSQGGFSDVALMLRGMNTMSMESAMYLSAVVIGACMSLAVQTLPIWSSVQAGSQFGGFVILFCMLVVPLAGMLLIPHSVLVVLLAELFGATTLGQAHGLSLALALSAGWAMAVATSPIAAATILTGNICGVSSKVVGASLNRSFALLLGGVAALFISVLYLLGY